MDPKVRAIYDRALKEWWGDDKMYSDPKLESRHLRDNKYEIHLNSMSSGGPGAPYVKSSVIILEPALDELGKAFEHFIHGEQSIYASGYSNVSRYDWGKYE